MDLRAIIFVALAALWLPGFVGLSVYLLDHLDHLWHRYSTRRRRFRW